MAFTRSVMTGADGIALGSLSPAGVQTAMSLFALLGLYFLILPLLSLLALVRYRAMIPLMFLFMLLIQLASRVLLQLHPIDRSTATPIGFYVNLAILALLAIGFVLSLWNRSATGKPGDAR